MTPAGKPRVVIIGGRLRRPVGNPRSRPGAGQCHRLHGEGDRGSIPRKGPCSVARAAYPMISWSSPREPATPMSATMSGGGSRARRHRFILLKVAPRLLPTLSRRSSVVARDRSLGCAPWCAGSGSAATFRPFWKQRNESARLAIINHGHHHYARPAFPSGERGFDTGSMRSHWEQVPQTGVIHADESESDR